MGGHTAELNGRASLPGRSLRRTAAIISALVIVVSTVRLLLYCMRAVIPAACATATLLQLLESRSRPPAASDKCRLVALAGTWGTAAFCDCTVASEYWLTPAHLAEPFQFISLPLACASFCASAAAVFLSSRLATADGPTIRAVEANEQSEEQAPLASPEVVDNTLDSPSARSADDSPLLSPSAVGCCSHVGTAGDGGATRPQSHCQCIGCYRDRVDARASGIGGLPTVTTFTTCGPVDFLGKHSPCGPAPLSNLDGNVLNELPSQPIHRGASDRDHRDTEHPPFKESAFFPSHVREGGLLAGFAAFDGSRTSFRKPPEAITLDAGLPRATMNEFCNWNSPCARIVCERDKHRRLCREERQKGSPSRLSISASTAASLDHISSDFSTTSTGEEDSGCPSRCCGGSSPLLSEFLEGGKPATTGPLPEKQAIAAPDRCGIAVGSHLQATERAQDVSIPGPFSAGSHGVETGWKPYLMMFGFQGSGGCKRDGDRMKRIGDLKWLDVMIVDADGEPSVGFGGWGGSRVCDV